MDPSAPRHSVSVAAVITDDEDRVLVLQRRDNARWEPPGGVLELDEDVHRGLLREVGEETGLQVAVDRLTGVYKNMTLSVVALVFRCRVVSGEPTVNDEARAFRWITANDVPGLLANVFAVRVLDGLRPGPVAVRAHDGTVVLDGDPPHSPSTSTSA